MTIIDWEHLPTYKTIMAIGAGSGLLKLARLAADVQTRPEGGVTRGERRRVWRLGAILVCTGLHMTLTWPLAPEFPFDSIVFDGTSLGFGTLLLGAPWYLWSRGAELLEVPDVAERAMRVARLISVFVAALGLSLLAIGAGGVRYRLFVASPEEPISGWYFAGYPSVEAIFISGLWALVGIGALVFAAVVNLDRRLLTLALWTWGASGALFALFGALSFVTHIGLIFETM